MNVIYNYHSILLLTDRYPGSPLGYEEFAMAT